MMQAWRSILPKKSVSFWFPLSADAMAFPSDDGRTRWPKIVAAVWLLLVSALTVVNSVGLSRLTEQSRASAQDAHVQALGTRLADLEQQVEAIKCQPRRTSTPPAAVFRVDGQTLRLPLP